MPIVTVPIDFDPVQYLANYSDLQTTYSSITNANKKNALLAKHYAETGIKEFRSYYPDKHIPITITNDNLYTAFKTARIVGKNIAFDVPVGDQYFVPDTSTATYTAPLEHFETVTVSLANTLAQPTSSNVGFETITTSDTNININNTSNTNYVVILKGTGEDQTITLNYDNNSIGKSGSIGLLYYDSILKNNLVFNPNLDIDFDNPIIHDSDIIYNITNKMQLNTTSDTNTPWNDQIMYVKHTDIATRLDGTYVTPLPVYTDLTKFISTAKAIDYDLLENTASFNDNTTENELKDLTIFDKIYVHINTTVKNIPANTTNLAITTVGTYNYDSYYYSETTLKLELQQYIIDNPPVSPTVIDVDTNQTTISSYVLTLLPFDEYASIINSILSLTYTSTCDIVVKYNSTTFDIVEVVSVTVTSGKALTLRIIFSCINRETNDLYWGSITFATTSATSQYVFFANTLINNDLVVTETIDDDANSTYNITLDNSNRYIRELKVQISRIVNVIDVLHSDVSAIGYNTDTKKKSASVGLVINDTLITTGQEYKINPDYTNMYGSLTKLAVNAKLEFI